MRTTPGVIFILRRVSQSQTTLNSGSDDAYDSTDPDRDETVAEQTNNHLLSTRLFIFLKVLYIKLNFSLSFTNPLLKNRCSH